MVRCRRTTTRRKTAKRTVRRSTKRKTTKRKTTKKSTSAKDKKTLSRLSTKPSYHKNRINDINVNNVTYKASVVRGIDKSKLPTNQKVRLLNSARNQKSSKAFVMNVRGKKRIY